MTIHWKALEQHSTVELLFVFQFYPVCNFETFISFGLSGVKGLVRWICSNVFRVLLVTTYRLLSFRKYRGFLQHRNITPVPDDHRPPGLRQTSPHRVCGSFLLQEWFKNSANTHLYQPRPRTRSTVFISLRVYAPFQR